MEIPSIMNQNKTIGALVSAITLQIGHSQLPPITYETASLDEANKHSLPLSRRDPELTLIL